MDGRPLAFSGAIMTSLGRSILPSTILLLLLALPTVSSQSVELTRYETCYLRCVGGCVQNATDIDTCKSKHCTPYERVDFCQPEDAACWSVCRDLGQATRLPAPTNVHVDYSNGTRTIEWQDVPGASIYTVQYRTAGAQFDENNSELTPRSVWRNATLPANNSTGDKNFCDPFNVRIAAFSKTGVSAFSSETVVDSPKPSVSPQLKLVSVKYSREHFVSDFYFANGTIIITFEFDDQHWPLGVDDLSVTPMFNLINCQVPDFAQTVPMAEFGPTNVPRQLSARLGADLMYRRCRYVYYTQSATSSQCHTETNYYSPPVNALRTLDINCSTVQNSPCLAAPAPPSPVCGQVATYSVVPVTPEGDIKSDLTKPISVNLTFTPIARVNEAPTLYYVAMFGDAIPYEAPDQEALQGVNQTDVIVTVPNCGDVRRPCPEPGPPYSFILDDVYLDALYGVTVCAIKSNENVVMPSVITSDKSSRPRSLKVFIDKTPYITDYAPLIVGLVVGVVLLLIVLVLLYCFCRMRKMKTKNEKLQMQKDDLLKQVTNPYTDMPKRSDIWEIDRRNVDVYPNKKLGSGAFGAVYLGKLIGKALGHHDAMSPLGVNLMRTENCEVAIKTLPESADEESKAEFLREIMLMKSIGYHERLVNMLACVTESEPLLLVVEFCSDGDLLQFLRFRCKYMMKLDDLGINYAEPTEEDNIDLALIVTMKQLLMFAVQISYGLEYLSQKGFVHRDVAARNVLVDGGSACKIGDFGLCRQIGKYDDCYKSRGGRLPLKWMSPEAIRDYEFSTKSDVWAFGVLLFEIITLGGCPYPEWRAAEVLPNLERGERMPQPDNCPNEIYSLMKSCWHGDQTLRPDFSLLRQRLATQLEEVTEEYSYLKLDSAQNYYNVQYEDDGRIDVAEMPARLPRRKQQQPLPDAAAAAASPSSETAAPASGVANPAFSVEVECEN